MPLDQLQVLLSKFEGQPVAFDFETSGLQACDPGAWVRSVSFANDAGCVAIDFRDMADDSVLYLLDWMARQQLIAHNFSFDAAWYPVATGGKFLPMECYHVCTLGMFKQLANEGWFEQRHGLKLAMTDILGWPESNEAEVYDYMKANDCIMGEVDWRILGEYNALDSGATWQLYKYFMEVIESYKEMWGEFFLEYHKEDFMNEVNLIVLQQWEGMLIDKPQLLEYGSELDQQIEVEYARFMDHPEVKEHIKEYNDYIITELLGKEPNKMTKAGKPSKNWPKWRARYDENKDVNHYNLNSPKQLIWLFYMKMSYACVVFTDTGAKSCDANALPFLGEPGRILVGYRKLINERKFLTATENVMINGRVHPQYKLPGTNTGRLSGGIVDE